MRRQLRTFRPAPTTARARRDRGTALTEFVIIIPLFIVLLFWSEFFVDTGIVKMKMEEASRYTVWELTAQRDPAEIAVEVKDRFADLNSPADLPGSLPATRSFRNISMLASLSVGQTASMSGSSPAPVSFPNNPVLSALTRGLFALSNRTVDGYVSQLNRGGGHWKTDREYTSKVDLTVANTLFPTGSIFGIFFDAHSRLNSESVVSRLHFRAASPLLLVDTWKAWPGPYAYTASKPNTDVYRTFTSSGANAVETELSKRVGDVVFAGLGKNGVLGVIGIVLQFLGLVNPVSTQTWDQQGPIVSWPGAPPLHSWSAGQSAPIQRIGDLSIKTGGGTNASMLSNIQSPEPGIDRSRYTTPSRINSQFWGPGIGGLSVDQVLNPSAGGLQHTPGIVPKLVAPTTVNKATANPYITLYDSTCRDGYYMGATKSGISRFKTADYYGQTNPGCPGSSSAGGGGCTNGWCP